MIQYGVAHRREGGSFSLYPYHTRNRLLFRANGHDALQSVLALLAVHTSVRFGSRVEPALQSPSASLRARPHPHPIYPTPHLHHTQAPAVTSQTPPSQAPFKILDVQTHTQGYQSPFALFKHRHPHMFAIFQAVHACV